MLGLKLIHVSKWGPRWLHIWAGEAVALTACQVVAVSRSTASPELVRRTWWVKWVVLTTPADVKWGRVYPKVYLSSQAQCESGFGICVHYTYAFSLWLPIRWKFHFVQNHHSALSWNSLRNRSSLIPIEFGYWTILSYCQLFIVKVEFSN